jgi:hypothetical protein
MSVSVPDLPTTTLHDSRFAAWRVRVARWHRRAAALLPHYTGMSRADAARWRAARSMADLGDLVVAWLHGDIQQTPGHCGPPEGETAALTNVLGAVNRAGFVTDNSQLAEHWDGNVWNTWVQGFATDATLRRIREVTAGEPLRVEACRGGVHAAVHGWRCPGAEAKGFWKDACPHVRGMLRDAWYVTITDLKPGRNDVLWRAMWRFARPTEMAPARVLLPPWKAAERAAAREFLDELGALTEDASAPRLAWLLGRLDGHARNLLDMLDSVATP